LEEISGLSLLATPAVYCSFALESATELLLVLFQPHLFQKEIGYELS
jgi:hypothetical protein